MENTFEKSSEKLSEKLPEKLSKVTEVLKKTISDTWFIDDDNAQEIILKFLLKVYSETEPSKRDEFLEKIQQKNMCDVKDVMKEDDYTRLENLRLHGLLPYLQYE